MYPNLFEHFLINWDTTTDNLDVQSFLHTRLCDSKSAPEMPYSKEMLDIKKNQFKTAANNSAGT